MRHVLLRISVCSFVLFCVTISVWYAYLRSIPQTAWEEIGSIHQRDSCGPTRFISTSHPHVSFQKTFRSVDRIMHTHIRRFIKPLTVQHLHQEASTTKTNSAHMIVTVSSTPRDFGFLQKIWRTVKSVFASSKALQAFKRSVLPQIQGLPV